MNDWVKFHKLFKIDWLDLSSYVVLFNVSRFLAQTLFLSVTINKSHTVLNLDYVGTQKLLLIIMQEIHTQ